MSQNSVCALFVVGAVCNDVCFLFVGRQHTHTSLQNYGPFIGLRTDVTFFKKGERLVLYII